MTMTVNEQIDRAVRLGQQLEDLVTRRAQYPAGERNLLLITNWSLIFDYDKGILNLLSNKFYASAFALLRPIVEAVARAHLALMCSQADLLKIQRDTYRVKFSKIGKEVDKFFDLNGVFAEFLKDSQQLLHSFTHSGMEQLARRFDGNDIAARYRDEEIIAAVGVGASAVFMVTALVTKHFKFEDEWKASNDLFAEYGKS